MMIKNKILQKILIVWGFILTIPFRIRVDKVHAPKLVPHDRWIDFLSEKFNKKGMRILEIGSRNVTGANHRHRFSEAEYIGMDFYMGENVDVVGDVHKLNTYFNDAEKFDLIFSSAVFEHLCMPWVAAIEIQKALKIGGFVFIETHFSFSSHERPWNFFQFSDIGLRALFSNALGFNLIDSGMCNPIAGVFSQNADKYLRYRMVTELYCHSEILCQKRCEISDYNWNNFKLDDIVDDTKYPPPNIF